MSLLRVGRWATRERCSDDRQCDEQQNVLSLPLLSIAKFELHALLIFACSRSDGGGVDVQRKVSSPGLDFLLRGEVL